MPNNLVTLSLSAVSRLAKLAKNNLDSLMTVFESGPLYSITNMKYRDRRINLEKLSVLRNDF